AEDVGKAVDWFLLFWEKLATVLPGLKRLTLPDRQKVRQESLVGWAIAIQGYIRLARRFYDDKLELSLLQNLSESHKEDGKTYDFFSWNNPAFQRAGIIVPAVNKKGETKLTVRNSHQTRRAMAEVLANKIGIKPKTLQVAA